MEQLAKAIEHFVAEVEEAAKEDDRPAHERLLRNAAQVWACLCIENYYGELLRKGLDVSAAIADFLAELEAA